MGSIHAVHVGIRMLRVVIGVGILVTANLLFASYRGALADLLNLVQVDVLLATVVAVIGWRFFGKSPREGFVWHRRALQLAWLATPFAPILAYLVAIPTAWHVVSHTRQGTKTRRRANTDMTAVGLLAVLGGMLLLLGATDVAVSLDGVGVLVSLAAIVTIIYRLYFLERALDPGVLNPAWREHARRLDAAIEGDRSRFILKVPAGDRLATLRVCRDPVPPWTELELALPELAGVTARRRIEGEAGGMPLGNLVLDRLLEHVEGDAEAARVLADPDGPWPEILHGWHAVLKDGVLVAVFEGECPRPEWVGAPASALGREPSTDGWDGNIVDQLIDGCRRAVASVARPGRTDTVAESDRQQARRDAQRARLEATRRTQR